MPEAETPASQEPAENFFIHIHTFGTASYAIALFSDHYLTLFVYYQRTIIMPDKKPGGGIPVILYDEHCNLCSATVKFILRNDPRGTFRFLGLRSGNRKKWYPLSVNEGAYKSVILVENGEKYYRSGAVLRIFRRLRFPVNLLYGFVVVPRFIRDALYNRVAENRFRLFGRREVPLEVAPQWKDRFMD